MPLAAVRSPLETDTIELPKEPLLDRVVAALAAILAELKRLLDVSMPCEAIAEVLLATLDTLFELLILLASILLAEDCTLRLVLRIRELGDEGRGARDDTETGLMFGEFRAGDVSADNDESEESEMPLTMGVPARSIRTSISRPVMTTLGSQTSRCAVVFSSSSETFCRAVGPGPGNLRDVLDKLDELLL